MEPSMPTATVARLSRYLAVLDSVTALSISSEALAEMTGGNGAQVRKDLSYLSASGTRGVGYDTRSLHECIRRALGLGEERRVIIVGAGNLGAALAGYSGFPQRGFQVCGLFDKADHLIGTTVAGHRVRPLDQLARCVDTPRSTIGVISVPAGAAQSVFDVLISSGIVSILNFAPVLLDAPAGVDVRQVDLSTELHILSHRLTASPRRN